MNEDEYVPKAHKVNLESSLDRTFWRNHFQTTEAILDEAVTAVGPNPLDVGTYLAKRLTSDALP
jgi:hypothetical protein